MKKMGLRSRVMRELGERQKRFERGVARNAGGRHFKTVLSNFWIYKSIEKEEALRVVNLGLKYHTISH